MKTRKSKSEISSIDQKIVDLWQDNVSAQSIADTLGITKNAVIGKVARIRNRGYDLRKRPSVPVINIEELRTPIKKPLIAWVPVLVEEPENEPEVALKEPHISGPKTLMDLKIDDCRYIIEGERAPLFLFCGQLKASKTYCAAHHKLCYVPVPKKVKARPFSLHKLTYTSPER